MNTDYIIRQLEAMTMKVNHWCNFAIICGSVALALSIVCAIYLLFFMKGEDVYDNCTAYRIKKARLHERRNK